MVGANALDLIQIIDGVNEAGLAGGLFYFPGYAHYQQVTQQEIGQSLAPWELMTWLLTSFATVAEVKKALATIKVTSTEFGPWGMVLPIHAIVHDGKESLVIEYRLVICICMTIPWEL